MTRIGFLAAGVIEGECLLRGACPGLQRRPDGSTLAVSGMGRDLARSASRLLVADGCSGLVSVGVAGALDPALRPADLVVPEGVVTADGRRLRADPAWSDRVTLAAGGRTVRGWLAEALSVVTTPAAKSDLHRRTSSVGVDMETAALAEVAAESGLPWIALRVIADGAGDVVPDAVLGEALDQFGRPRLGRLVGRLLARPTQIPAVIRLGRNSSRALARLRTLAERGIPSVSIPPK